MRFSKTRDVFKISVEGKIDSSNVSEFEKDLFNALAEKEGQQLVFDMRKLTYISSAGLRVLLRLRKMEGKPCRIINVSDNVYEIFDLTGFSDMFEINRTMREITYDTSKRISKCINGVIYRIDNDTMLKVYNRDVRLAQIKQERDNAHKALIHDIPTLIPYDVVDTVNGYGIVMEAANMETLAQSMKKHPDNIEAYAVKFADFLSDLHHTEIEPGVFPDIKERYREWINNASPRLTSKELDAIHSLVEKVSDSNTFVHGDINPTNVMTDSNEMYLIDMAGPSVGNPLFDLQGLYSSLVMEEREKPMFCSSYYGIPADYCSKFWDCFIRAYMSKSDKVGPNLMPMLNIYYVLNKKLFLG